MTACSRCNQPLGLITYTVTAWVRDTIVAEATLCPVCGGFLSSPSYMPEMYDTRPAIEAGP